MNTYSTLRTEFEFLHYFQTVCKTYGVSDRTWLRKARKRIASLTDKLIDPLAKPLGEEWRYRYSEDGESACQYAIFEDCGKTDEEIEEWLNEDVAFPPIYSQYDCTGKPVTYGIHWKRTPVGIVVIHRWTLDI